VSASLTEAAPIAKILVPAGTTAGEAVVTARLPKGGPDAVVVVRDPERQLRDLTWAPDTDVEVEPVAMSSPDGLAVLRHSTAHVMAQAVQDIFPEAKLGIGPPIEDGFYYDFDVPKPFTPDDLGRIETRMREIVNSGQRFQRRVIASLDAARDELANEPYKLELIDVKGGDVDTAEVMEVGGGELTIYDNLDAKTGKTCWSDLCRGPHVPSTNLIKIFQLMRGAGAYWRGDEKRPMLQRIYGTAWANKKDLEQYLWRREQAELRDHRKIGRELELFHFDPTAPGMPYWLPKGMRVLNSLLSFWRDEHEARGYEEISTPLVNNKRLWELSGHWDHFRDDMFVVPVDEATTYALKPMNCPNAMVVYNLKTRSYRDLPLRLSDCDLLHRNERSGTLHGLLRCQKFQQDDAHVFVTPAHIREEYERIFDLCDRFYTIFDLKYRLRIGTRPEGFIGDRETWDAAEETLTSILQERTGGDYDIEAGGGAFYGPKIDILMQDAIGRNWQTGTIQLDFQLPRRFGCVYVDENGQRQTPVVIHRVVYGSLERFLGIYIEHTAGVFPLWISPVHAVVLPVSDQFTDYAARVTGRLRAAAARAELDGRGETLGNRVRQAQQMKVPVVVVVGAREEESATVSLRLRGGRKVSSILLDDFADQLGQDLRDRRVDLTVDVV
jgi:threonyl-tRNA synthetase